MNSPLKKKQGPLFTKMFHKIIRDPTIKPIDKCVLMALKSHTNGDGMCCPPLDMIAGELGVNRDTVYLALRRLEEKRLVTRHSRVERGNQISNAYTFDDEFYARHLAQSGRRKNRIPTLSQKSDTRKMKEETPNVIPMPKAAKG